MEVLTTIFYFVLVLGILVLVHEFGHFIAAKLTGMRAEVFSIGMGPRLIGYHKRLGITLGKLPTDFEFDDNTEYRLSLLPIGGYVKISGMIDESMDKEFINKEPQSYEFRSKKAWQKFIVLSAGVIMNFILAIIIFAFIAFTNGQSLLKTTTIGYIAPQSIAEQIGLKAGDKIIKINNIETNSWNDVLENLTFKKMGKQKDIILIRDSRQMQLSADGSKIIRTLADKKPLGLEPDGIRVYFQMVETLKPAGKAGFMKGDTVLSVDTINIVGVSQFSNYIQNHKEKQVNIKIARKDSIFNVAVTPNSDGKIGVMLASVIVGKVEHINYNLFQSIQVGFRETINAISLFIGSITQIFNGTLSFKESVGGPVMIAQQASQQAEMGLASFLNFIALLSVTLAVINILPLPALDGGHLVFVIIEAIIKREVSPKVKIAIQQAGVVLLLMLMVFVIYNDFTR
jgi:regulator of sigma E protease